MLLFMILGHNNRCPWGEVPDNVGSAEGDFFSFPGRILLTSRFWADFKLKRSENRLCSVERKACNPSLISSVSLSK